MSATSMPAPPLTPPPDPSPAPLLSPQIIGQTENAHRPLMDRVLAGTGTTFRQWVALSIAAAAGAVDNSADSNNSAVSNSAASNSADSDGPAGEGGGIDRDHLVGRMTGALQITETEAAEALAGLAAAEFLQAVPAAGSRVVLTAAGQARYQHLRAAIDQVIDRLYGDIPPGDLATAGRVLTLITARAHAELARD
jgi:hypothetical protein